MPRKQIAQTEPRFVFRARDALRLSTKELAAVLGVKSPTITGYERGNSVPQSVYLKIMDLLGDRYVYLRDYCHCPDLKFPMDIDNMNVQQNILGMTTVNEFQPYQLGRLLRRKATPSALVYPLYRLTPARYKVLVQALVQWREQVRGLQASIVSPQCQRDYLIELDNILHIVTTLPRRVPHDVYLREHDWPTVSSALQNLVRHPEFHYPAQALYSHWKKHRFAGFRNNKR